MVRNRGVIVSVKVPIAYDKMTRRQKILLSQITGRDTRVIKAYLGVIERHENTLLTGHNGKRIHAGRLDELTLTATKGRACRTQVPHDFKARFPNISTNELQECRDVAIAMWHSHIELRRSRPLQAAGYTKRKIPRNVFTKCFDFISKRKGMIKHWLSLRDSLQSRRKRKSRHAKLMIPLSPSSYHLNRMKEGEVKSVLIYKDRAHKWWVVFSVTLTVTPLDMSGRPPAVLAIDLGIKKSACTVLLTQTGYKHVHYWKQQEKLKRMQHYDAQVASLQFKKDGLLQVGADASEVMKKLRELSGKRNRLSREYDRKLVKDVSDHILELSQRYDLYISIGRLKGIRNKARKGNGRGRAFRGMIHRWTYARVRDLLWHKLASLGFKRRRFRAVPEQWTSIKCHKCGHKGIRPKQSLFICHTCGYRANADLNGAINIGRRLIKLIPSLRDEKQGLGMWLLPGEKSTPKARRKKSSSKGKSSRPQRSPASKGESVADCYDQTTLEEFASSDDPAMASTVENPSTSGSGSPGPMQRTEAQSRGRNHVPVRAGKAHVILDDPGRSVAGDSSREQGGTQKFLEVHSP